jgi:dienelactone hydrolase
MKRRTLLLTPAAALAQTGTPGAADRNDAYAKTLERELQRFILEEYPARAARLWRRDYSSEQALMSSVEPNRRRYRDFIAPPEWRTEGKLERRNSEVPGAQWLSLKTGPLAAEGLLAMPPGAQGPVPLVIAQHGIDSTPERVFGAGDKDNLYHDYGNAMLKAGYAVLAPFNLSTVDKRNRIERLAKLAGTTLPGIEFARMQALLGAVLAEGAADAQRVGMWGISLGGLATMFWMPLEPRIKCGIVCAWFNHRRNKMAIPDPRYSCFLDTKEEHAFFRGWLTEFTDSDVASLICPRPLMVQHGKQDHIAWWPQVVEEFEAARQHYRRLGIDNRIAMDLHDGVHEIGLESGMAFLKRWL